MPGRRMRLRDRVLKEKGLLAPGRGAIVPIEDAPTPFTKTTLMKLLEVKHKKSITVLLFIHDNIYVTAKDLGISPSVVSRWKKRIRDAYPKS